MDFHSSVVTEKTGFQGRVSGAVGGVSGFWGVMGREQYDGISDRLRNNNIIIMVVWESRIMSQLWPIPQLT